MRKLLILLSLFFVGCTATMSQVTAPNRENLLKLSIGMPKDHVLNTMGTASVTANPCVLGFCTVGAPPMTITNPYRSETLQGKDKVFEVIYYVTDIKRVDGAITDDELTPLVFDNGKLIGWGWGFLQDNAQKYEIRIR